MKNKTTRGLKILKVIREVKDFNGLRNNNFKQIEFLDEKNGLTKERYIWKNRFADYEKLNEGVEVPGEIIVLSDYLFTRIRGESLKDAFNKQYDYDMSVYEKLRSEAEEWDKQQHSEDTK